MKIFHLLEGLFYLLLVVHEYFVVDVLYRGYGGV